MANSRHEGFRYPYQRYRTRGSYDYKLYTQQFVKSLTCIDSTSYYAYSAPSLVSFKTGDLWTMKDWVIPGYHRMSLEGKVFFNTLDSTRLMVEAADGDYEIINIRDKSCSSPVRYTGWKETGPVFAKAFIGWKGQPITQMAELGTISPTVYARATKEAWTKANASRANGKANFVESLAEIDQLFGMIKHPLDNVAKFVRSFKRNKDDYKNKRRKFRYALKNGKAVTLFVSGEWLRFRYGIMPLMNDVQAALQALETGYTKEEKRYTARATSQAEKFSVLTGQNVYDQIRVNWQRILKQEYSVRVAILDEYVRTPATDLGLTVQNLATVAWELVSYSFVVDWFVNVGDYINSNFPKLGVRNLGASTSVRTTTRLVANSTSFEVIDPAKYALLSGPGGQLNVVEHRHSRIPWTMFSRDGDLTVKEDFKFDHFYRAADAAALVGQLLKGLGFETRDGPVTNYGRIFWPSAPWYHR